MRAYLTYTKLGKGCYVAGQDNAMQTSLLLLISIHRELRRMDRMPVTQPISLPSIYLLSAGQREIGE